MVPKKKIFHMRKNSLTKALWIGKILLADASVAHLVERHLAKVEVASSSLVTRSISERSFLVGRPFLFAGATSTGVAQPDSNQEVRGPRKTCFVGWGKRVRASSLAPKAKGRP